MRLLVGRALAVLVLAVGLAGCALPPAVMMVGYVGDGVLVASTGKTPGDVGLSLASGKDCATWHLVKDENFCQDAAHDEPEAVPARVVADEALAERQIAQAQNVAPSADDSARASLTAKTLAAALQPVATADAKPALLARVAKPAVPLTAVAASASSHKTVAAAPGHKTVASAPGHRKVAAAPGHRKVAAAPGDRKVASAPGHTRVAAVHHARHRVAAAGHRNRHVAVAKGHRHHFASAKRRPTLAAAHPPAKANPMAAEPVVQSPPVLVGLASTEVVAPPATRDHPLPRLAAAWSALLAAFTVR